MNSRQTQVKVQGFIFYLYFKRQKEHEVGWEVGTDMERVGRGEKYDQNTLCDIYKE